MKWSQTIRYLCLIATTLLPLASANARLQPQTDGSTVKGTIDVPQDGSTISIPLSVSGWVIDQSNTKEAGTGIDRVEIYGGDKCTGNLLGEGVPNLYRSDLIAVYGPKANQTSSGYLIDVKSVQSGLVQFTVCAHSTISLQEVTLGTRTVTIDGLQGYLDTPVQDSVIGYPVQIAGWVFNAQAKPNAGTGVDKVGVYDGTGCLGKMLGEVTAFTSRPDVPIALGRDASDVQSGFEFNLYDSLGAKQTITLCARKTGETAFLPFSQRSFSVEQTPFLTVVINLMVGGLINILPVLLLLIVVVAIIEGLRRRPIRPDQGNH